MPQSPAARKIGRFHPLPPQKSAARHELLSREREVALFKQIAAGGIIAEQARATLVKFNQGLVHSIAFNYRGNGVDHLDLVQEGNLGLLRAIEKFDYKRGYKFCTYAQWWVHVFIDRSVKNSGKPIRIPLNAQSDRRLLLEIHEQIKEETGKCPSAEALAKLTDHSPKRIRQLLSAPAGQSISLSTPAFKGEEDGPSLLERVVDPAPSQEDLLDAKKTQQLLQLYIDALKPREQMALELLTRKEKSVQETAAALGITPQWVHEIMKRTMIKLNEMHDIVQCAPQKLAAWQLKKRYAMRQRIRKALAKAAPLAADRPLEIDDIARSANMERRDLFAARKRDARIEEMVTQTLDTSRRDHIIQRIKDLSQAVKDGAVPQPNIYKEVASSLGIWVTTLTAWRRTYARDVDPLLEELLEHAKRTPGGAGKNPRAIARENARLRKLEAAARKYQRANPGKLIPAKLMTKKTGIPESTLLKLIKEHGSGLKSRGIEFRASRKGRKKETHALARLAELERKIEQGKVKAPKNKGELCARLGISRNTIISWEKDSPEVKKAVAAVIACDKKAMGRLHRLDQLPAEKRPALLARGYEKLAGPDRDLGRDPVKISELADAAASGGRCNSPESINYSI
jgi:RNA polymerase sigma factor (sigma-70 family)